MRAAVLWTGVWFIECAAVWCDCRLSRLLYVLLCGPLIMLLCDDIDGYVYWNLACRVRSGVV